MVAAEFTIACICFMSMSPANFGESVIFHPYVRLLKSPFLYPTNITIWIFFSQHRVTPKKASIFVGCFHYKPWWSSTNLTEISITNHDYIIHFPRIVHCTPWFSIIKLSCLFIAFSMSFTIHLPDLSYDTHSIPDTHGYLTLTCRRHDEVFEKVLQLEPWLNSTGYLMRWLNREIAYILQMMIL